MKIFKRPVLLVSALIVIVLIVGGAFMQVSTQRALERAEAFQFRRMLVTQRGNEDTFRFFFVTNRDTEFPEEETLEQFGNQQRSQLTFGLFDTGIEASLGIGMLVNPSDWFQNEEIKLYNVATLDKPDFLAQLRGQVQASSYKSIFININGFRERFPSALRKTAFLAHVLDINTPIVVFDWPGDQGSTPRGYRLAQTVARDSAADLAATLRLLANETGAEKLWVMANSMGGEVVVNAFHELYANPGMDATAAKIEHVFLTAPDVSYEQFGKQFNREVAALADDLTVYVSSNDRALLMSRVLNRGRRLGESTVDLSNPDQSSAALRTYELLEPGSRLVTLVDITPVNRTRNFHNFSLETPEFFDDLYMRLTHEDIPRSRRLYRAREQDGREYWILTRGR